MDEASMPGWSASGNPEPGEAGLDGARSSLGWWQGSLPAGGLELGDLQSPFRPNPFCGPLARGPSRVGKFLQGEALFWVERE